MHVQDCVGGAPGLRCQLILLTRVCSRVISIAAMSLFRRSRGMHVGQSRLIGEPVLHPTLTTLSPDLEGLSPLTVVTQYDTVYVLLDSIEPDCR